MQHQSTVVWLKIGAGLVIVFGLITALGAYPLTAGVLSFLVDMIKWPVDGSQSITNEEFRLLSAVSGGVMVGWGLMIWLIAERLYDREPQLSRLMIMVSVGAWFVVDSLASIMAGAALNAVFNISFLVLFFVPMMGKVTEASARGEQH